jgi:hypothetical protein
MDAQGEAKQGLSHPVDHGTRPRLWLAGSLGAQ